MLLEFFIAGIQLSLLVGTGQKFCVRGGKQPTLDSFLPQVLTVASLFDERIVLQITIDFQFNIFLDSPPS
jgi:hypothetical protein